MDITTDEAWSHGAAAVSFVNGRARQEGERYLIARPSRLEPERFRSEPCTRFTCINVRTNESSHNVWSRRA